MQQPLSERQQMAILMRSDRSSSHTKKSPSSVLPKTTLTKAQLNKPPPIWLPNDYSSWIPQKQAAWQNLRDDPSPFYFWYTPPGFPELLASQAWSPAEISQLHTLVQSRTLPGEQLTATVWAYLSMYIPGRPGNQLLKLYATLHPELRIPRAIPASINKYSKAAKIGPVENKLEKSFPASTSSQSSPAPSTTVLEPVHLTRNHTSKELSMMTSTNTMTDAAKSLAKMIIKTDVSPPPIDTTRLNTSNESTSSITKTLNVRGLGTKARPNVSKLFSARNAIAASSNQSTPISTNVFHELSTMGDNDAATSPTSRELIRLDAIVSASSQEFDHDSVMEEFDISPPQTVKKKVGRFGKKLDSPSLSSVPPPTISQTVLSDQNNVINAMDENDNSIQVTKKTLLNAQAIKSTTATTASSMNGHHGDDIQPDGPLKRSRFGTSLSSISSTSVPSSSSSLQSTSLLANFVPTPLEQLLADYSVGIHEQTSVKRQKSMTNCATSDIAISLNPIYDPPNILSIKTAPRLLSTATSLSSTSPLATVTTTITPTSTYFHASTPTLPPSYFVQPSLSSFNDIPTSSKLLHQTAFSKTPTPSKPKQQSFSSTSFSTTSLSHKATIDLDSTETIGNLKTPPSHQTNQIPTYNFFSYYTPYNPLAQPSLFTQSLPGRNNPNILSSTNFHSNELNQIKNISTILTAQILPSAPDLKYSL